MTTFANALASPAEADVPSVSDCYATAMDDYPRTPKDRIKRAFDFVRSEVHGVHGSEVKPGSSLAQALDHLLEAEAYALEIPTRSES